MKYGLPASPNACDMRIWKASAVDRLVGNTTYCKNNFQISKINFNFPSPNEKKTQHSTAIWQINFLKSVYLIQSFGAFTSICQKIWLTDFNRTKKKIGFQIIIMITLHGCVKYGAIFCPNTVGFPINQD